MLLPVRSGGTAHSMSIAMVAGILVFHASSAVVRGGDQIADDAPGTPLAVTGIPIALEEAGYYGLGYWSFDAPATHGHGGSDSAIRAWLREQCLAIRYCRHGALGYGSLGYGGHGLDSGFYGFGLSFHRGYGYGGQSLGVGADGGDPYYGGTGYPPFGQPFPGVVGPLVVHPPVVSESDPGEPGYSLDYGPYTGALPYPETLFAPYVDAAAAGSYAQPSAAPPAPSPAPDRRP